MAIEGESIPMGIGPDGKQIPLHPCADKSNIGQRVDPKGWPQVWPKNWRPEPRVPVQGK
ncbi:MAG: hypothetical protein ACD_38C00177G0003 [uncultured bacterium]|uniref:Uncharacterized protein n=1 Tax=Candidatus Daviesbacteria bacterium GW2011_GWC2_40_12 TaxID=1618431 RepID=A0A0G0T503_9BACT|nr:MAG: hypothetical protein ACD_38C00177G0003 [uncultured bacterium]KKR17115.1 MAG: hypothetical protein UT45_C0003G0145 [Candidatus Daviesbacteria bacterium GW2011_GWA2_39_33]KKR23689.1 MAG: hypothetical protein UT54_C0040G0008 [Candidatus Daviesbacteria bacterium GW2011_GWB1_39_5]KKR42180.1 MAG: hypothetical protein UT77_C0004G0164 [Candidatus Daviesbacteria bacterium GW2011_GWC2_40_12]